MPSLQDTAYPRLKHNVSDKELATIYTPTLEELNLAEQHTKGSSAKLSFLILLKTFQRLGYAVPLASVPSAIIQHIAASTQLSASSTEFTSYDVSGTRRRHLSVIRAYLHLQPFTAAAQQVTVEVMKTAAMTKHDLVDLINIAIEELVHQRVELPAFSRLLRLAYQARGTITTQVYRTITAALNATEQGQIDTLFDADPKTERTPWNEIKRDSARPTITHLNELIERLNWLASLQVGTAALNQLPEYRATITLTGSKALT